jgi:hypothetical protein
MRAPVLAVGDDALGFWKALRDVFPETREQRCWWHKIANVLSALPKSAHPAGKAALAEIYNAEDKTHPLDGEGVPGRLRHEVPEGGRGDHRRCRRAARVLRLPRRALDHLRTTDENVNRMPLCVWATFLSRPPQLSSVCGAQPWSRWSARSEARTYDLDHVEDRSSVRL